MKTQNDRVLTMLKAGKTITPLEALQELSVFRLAARVKDLRNEGYDIGSKWVTVLNRYGEACRVKGYFLATSAA